MEIHNIGFNLLMIVPALLVVGFGLYKLNKQI